MPTSSTLTALLLAGRAVPIYGRVLADTREGRFTLLDPDTGGELRDERPAFVLSTENEATDKHILRLEWDLSRAAGSGVPVLWRHDQDRLLGQWQDLGVRSLEFEQALTGRAYFDPEDPDAQHRRGQIRRGILSSASVGWLPGEVTRRSDLDPKDPLYREPEEDMCGQPAEGLIMGSAARPNVLMEASLCSVPADGSATVTERLHRAAQRDLARTGAPRDLDALLGWLGQDPRVRAYIRRLTAQVLDERSALHTSSPAPRKLGDILRKGHV